jgi:hypothetical protein
MDNWVGKSYVFPDGDAITVMQIKVRDGNEEWVTYQIQQGPGVPRKLVMKLYEFNNTYGYLFRGEDNNK